MFDYRIEEGVGTVTLARPDTLNSLTFEVYAELGRLAQALLLMAEDHKEFYRAFTEKRPPRFTGR